jgi:Flp pilus assembly pilin Flp
MKKILARLWNEQIAQDLTEYALILLLIGLSAITATKTLASSIKGSYSNVGSDIASHTSSLGNLPGCHGDYCNPSSDPGLPAGTWGNGSNGGWPLFEWKFDSHDGWGWYFLGL